MAYTPKDNTGSLWVNDRKTNENHPDRTGTMMVEGKLYFLNGWLKKTQEPYLSLSAKLKTESKAAGASKQDMSDDAIPF